MEEDGNMGSEENAGKEAENTGKAEKKHKKRQKKILADLQKQVCMVVIYLRRNI